VNVGLYKNGKKIATMYPGRRTYKGAEDEQAVSEIAIRESLLEDFTSCSRDRLLPIHREEREHFTFT